MTSGSTICAIIPFIIRRTGHDPDCFRDVLHRLALVPRALSHTRNAVPKSAIPLGRHTTLDLSLHLSSPLLRPPNRHHVCRRPCPDRPDQGRRRPPRRRPAAGEGRPRRPQVIAAHPAAFAQSPPIRFTQQCLAELAATARVLSRSLRTHCPVWTRLGTFVVLGFGVDSCASSTARRPANT